MQISLALLRYPSVPLPLLSNLLIPPDWRLRRQKRQVGEQEWTQLLVCILLPVGSVWSSGGRDGRSGTAVALIRGVGVLAHVMNCTSQEISKPAWKSDDTKHMHRNPALYTKPSPSSISLLLPPQLHPPTLISSLTVHTSLHLSHQWRKEKENSCTPPHKNKK